MDIAHASDYEIIILSDGTFGLLGGVGLRGIMHGLAVLLCAPPASSIARNTREKFFWRSVFHTPEIGRA